MLIFRCQNYHFFYLQGQVELSRRPDACMSAWSHSCSLPEVTGDKYPRNTCGHAFIQGPVSGLRGEDDSFFQESCSGQFSPASYVPRTCLMLRRTGKALLWATLLQGRRSLLGFLDPSLTPKGRASPGGGFQDGNMWGIKNHCNNGAGLCVTVNVWRQGCPRPSNNDSAIADNSVLRNINNLKLWDQFFPKQNVCTEAQDIVLIK